MFLVRLELKDRCEEHQAVIGHIRPDMDLGAVSHALVILLILAVGILTNQVRRWNHHTMLPLVGDSCPRST